jgi:mannose-6-phosphate isomerase-like protein (cupin superfamily)
MGAPRNVTLVYNAVGARETPILRHFGCFGHPQLAGTVAICFTSPMAKNASRRNFLRIAPLAVAALPLTELLHANTVEAGQTASATAAPFKIITAETLATDAKELQAKPGNKDLFLAKELPFLMVMTTETAHSATEFEWHEGRDHILQVLEGTTVYEIGGTPKNGRNVKPGEWLAPTSNGATTLALKKGDTLVIPRNTPHKRMTKGSVTFTLISPTGPTKA